MKPKNRWYFTTSCILMLVFGVFSAAYMGVLAIGSCEELKYVSWLDVNSPVASLIICAFAGGFSMLGGLYGLLAKDSRVRSGGCFAVVTITVAYYVMALVLSSYSAEFVCICVMGILLSLLFAVTAFISRIRNRDEEARGEIGKEADMDAH